MVDNAQWDFFGSYQESGMIEKPLMRLIVQHAQPLGARMMSEIKLRGILHRQNCGLSLGSVISGLLMRLLKIVLIDLVVIEKAIGCFGLHPGLAGLRNGGLGIVGQLVGNLDKAFGQTGVAEISAAEFVFSPVGALIPRQRWYNSA